IRLRARRGGRASPEIRRRGPRRRHRPGCGNRRSPHARLDERRGPPADHRHRPRRLLVAFTQRALAQGRHLRPRTACRRNPRRLRSGRSASQSAPDRRRLPHRPPLLLLPDRYAGRAHQELKPLPCAGAGAYARLLTREVSMHRLTGWIAAVAIALCVSALPASAQEPAADLPPDAFYVDPAAAGWNAAALADAVSYVGRQKSTGFVVIHDNRIVAEHDWPLAED